MSRELREVIGAEDVVAIVLTCQCGSGVSLRVSESLLAPNRCPQCNTPWGRSPGVAGYGDDVSVNRLGELLHALGERNRAEGSPVTLGLQVPGAR